MPRKLKGVVAHHEKVIADTLTMILRRSNMDATPAYSGVSGLELVLSTNPDLAILCIVPAYDDDLNGVYAAVAIRSLVPGCRILLCPGGSGGWVDEPLKLAKARGYEFELIFEPIQLQELMQMSRELTGGDIDSIRPTVVEEPEERVQAAAQAVASDVQHDSSAGRWSAIRKFVNKLTRFE